MTTTNTTSPATDKVLRALTARTSSHRYLFALIVDALASTWDLTTTELEAVNKEVAWCLLSPHADSPVNADMIDSIVVSVELNVLGFEPEG